MLRAISRRAWWPSSAIRTTSSTPVGKIWGEQLKAEVLRPRRHAGRAARFGRSRRRWSCRCSNLLGEAFGFQKNAKGFRVLDPHVRVIQGDGIDRAMLATILEACARPAGRPTTSPLAPAAACCRSSIATRRNMPSSALRPRLTGSERDVFKQPVTDEGKRSKAGRMKLVRRDGKYVTLRDDRTDSEPDLLAEVFLDGEVQTEMSWPDVCRRAALTPITCRCRRMMSVD